MGEFQPQETHPRPPAPLQPLPVSKDRLPDTKTIQQLLDENELLLQTILACQKDGNLFECTMHQQLLHRNLVYLGTVAMMERTKRAEQS